MLKNKRKISAVINNAKKFKEIVQKYGSFHNYIESYNSTTSFENLMLFKEDLEANFDYLGGITVYHFMTDIGLPVLKPDRVIVRIFRRIGLIENEKQLLKTIIHEKKFAIATENSIRYIDIIFVSYGQESEIGVCLLKNPKCHLCGLTNICNYFKNKLNNNVK